MTREEAINEIRSWDFLNGKEINAIQTLIPELRESEDERIIEEIKFAVMQMPTERQDTKNRCLTWLEKQKEQEPQEPQVFCEAKAFDLGYKHDKEDAIKEQKSVWSEKDENIRKQLINICNEWLGGGFNARPCLDDVRWLKNLLEKQKEQKHPNGCFTCDEYKKGYEEGRRNGFTAGYNKAMKEVEQKEQKPVDYDHEMWKNCEANFEGGKKEVIENPERYGLQKPAEWSEEDERKRNELIKGLENRMGFGWANDPFSREEYISWLKSLHPVKQEWSEEDEKHINLIIRILDRQQCWDGATGKKFNPYQGEIDWLKSLRPQPKQEWSEKDERILYNVIAYVGYAAGERGVKDDDFKEANKWLKNLRYHTSWKPSEEQMKALEQAKISAVAGNFITKDGLCSLYEQLKKLM